MGFVIAAVDVQNSRLLCGFLEVARSAGELYVLVASSSRWAVIAAVDAPTPRLLCGVLEVTLARSAGELYVVVGSSSRWGSSSSR
ncbi:MAG: hypothetical protein AB7L94_43230, partial [Kofleriaceae bacterium]